MTLEERQRALGALGRSSSVWKAFISALVETKETEVSASAEPGLDNESRQFRAGRASLALDILDQFNKFMDEVERSADERS